MGTVLLALGVILCMRDDSVELLPPGLCDIQCSAHFCEAPEWRCLDVVASCACSNHIWCSEGDCDAGGT